MTVFGKRVWTKLESEPENASQPPTPNRSVNGRELLLPGNSSECLRPSVWRRLQSWSRQCSSIDYFVAFPSYRGVSNCAICARTLGQVVQTFQGGGAATLQGNASDCGTDMERPLECWSNKEYFKRPRIQYPLLAIEACKLCGRCLARTHETSAMQHASGASKE
jgi:hypothetical protein